MGRLYVVTCKRCFQIRASDPHFGAGRIAKQRQADARDSALWIPGRRQLDLDGPCQERLQRFATFR
jgi:hypothetical protein